jgi:uncharacterized membrane protein YdbT with pleckstrin-like domain
MTNYTESVLNNGESINFVARYHWIYMFLSLCWLTLGSLIIVGPFVFLYRVIDRYTSEIVVTNKRLIFKRGFIQRNTHEISLQSIEHISLNQSFFGRILDYGELIVTGKGNAIIKLPLVDDPISLRKALGEIA